MISFLVFYFVFSAIFVVGVRACAHKNSIPLGEFMMSILLGWLLLPFGLGMLVSYLINGKENE